MRPMATMSDGVQGFNQKRVLAILSASNGFLYSTAFKWRTLLAEKDDTEASGTSAQDAGRLNDRK